MLITAYEVLLHYQKYIYLSIVCLPFIGSAIVGLRGRILGNQGSQIIATICIIISTVLSLIAFFEVAMCRSSVSINLFSWIDSYPLQINWALHFDDLTVAILLPVLVVSSLVHIYSISYINDDPHTPRFFSYLSLFTASIVLLVTGDSYITLFLGWELIGIASYLLIGFWLTRIQTQKSAIKALTVNRVGDISLSIGFFIILWVFGSLDYATVLSVTPQLNETVLTIIGLFFLGGAISKSAQVPLHSWLADAIEGK